MPRRQTNKGPEDTPYVPREDKPEKVDYVHLPSPDDCPTCSGNPPADGCGTCGSSP